MIPRVTVLQLDTGFPRIAGDVGSPDSYMAPPQIIRIQGASVGKIVTDQPQMINIKPFENALKQATGDIIVTSCGFLSYWQAHLEALCDRPFISSALVALDGLAQTYTPDELRILTFDADALNAAHLGHNSAYTRSIIGLPSSHHLRTVIEQNLPTLNKTNVREQVSALLRRTQTPMHRHIVLECTNLPPYRAAIMAATGLPVTDILTCIEATCTGAIAQQFS